MKSKISKSTVIHISGIPGCGKTTYGRWLEEEKNFLHLDFDKLFHGQGADTKVALVQILQSTVGSPKSFIRALRKTGQPTVLD